MITRDGAICVVTPDRVTVEGEGWKLEEEGDASLQGEGNLALYCTTDLVQFPPQLFSVPCRT
jgi:hypothetical protein